MASAAANVPQPSLLHKMSKKISQLTKVIYILNTKSDEHEYAMQCMEQSYEAEIDAILKNASDKMNDLKKKLEEKDDGKGVGTLIEALKKKHEEEKQESMKRFALFQDQAEANEQALRNQSRDKIDGLRRDMEEMKNQFLVKMHSFGRVTKNLEESHAQNIEALKQVHNSDLSKWEEKYNKLLKEKEENEQELRERLTNALKQSNQEQLLAWEEKFNKYKIDMNEKHNNVIQQNSIAFQSQMQQKQAEFDAVIAQLQSQLDISQNECKKISADVTAKKARIAELEDECAALKKLRDRLQSQMGSASSEMQNNITSLEQQLQQVRIQLESTTKNLTNTTAELESKIVIVNEMKSTIKSKDSKIAELTQQLEQQKAKLTTQLKSMESRVDSTTSELENTKLELKEVVENMKSLIAEREVKITELNDILLQEQRKINGNRDTMETMRQRETDLLARIKALETSEATLHVTINECNTQLQSIKDQNTLLHNQLEQLMKNSNGSQEQIAKLNAQIDENNVVIRKLKTSEMKLKADLQRVLDNAASELKLHEDQVSKLNAEIEELKRINVTQSAELVKENTKLSTDLKANKMFSAKMEAECSNLTQQLELLQKQLEDSRSNLLREQELASNAVREANQKWSADRQNLQSELSLVRSQLQDDLARQYGDFMQEKSALVSRQDKEVRQLREMLQAAQLSGDEKLQEELSRMRTEYNREKASADAEFTSKLKSVQSELDRTKAESQDALAAKIKENQDSLEALRRDYEAKIDALRTAQQKVIAAANAEAEDRIKAGKDAMFQTCQQEQKQKLQEQKQQLEGISKQREQELLDKLTKDKGNVMAEYERKIQELNEDIASKFNQIKQVSFELSQSNASFDALRAEYTAKHDDWLKEREKLHEEKQSAISSLTAKQADEINQILQENALNINMRRKEHEKELESAEERHAETQRKLIELKLRWENRESRPDDLIRIKELVALLEASDKERKKALDDMKYYKLELINREENFNKNFGTSPNVGVMNVLKSSSGSTSSAQMQIQMMQGSNSTGKRSSLGQMGMGSGSNSQAGFHTVSKMGFGNSEVKVGSLLPQALLNKQQAIADGRSTSTSKSK
jgi:hypothetical protein